MLQLCSAASAAFLLASLFVWVRTLRRLAAGEAILPWEPVRPATWGLLDLILIATLLAASQAYAVEFVRARFGLATGVPLEKWGLQARAGLQLAISLATLAAVVGSVLWLAGRYRVRAADLGVAIRKCRYDLRLGSVVFLLLGPVIYGIQSLLVQFLASKHPLLELLKENPDPWFFMLSGFSAVVVGPRGRRVLFSRLPARLARTPGVARRRCRVACSWVAARRLLRPTRAIPWFPTSGGWRRTWRVFPVRRAR